MNFETIKRQAAAGEPLPYYHELYEGMAYLSLRHLYSLYRRRDLTKQDAKLEYGRIRQAYERGAQDTRQQREVYHRYQENLKCGEMLITELVKATNAEADFKELYLKAVDCIGCLTGETVTAQVIRAKTRKDICHEKQLQSEDERPDAAGGTGN